MQRVLVIIAVIVLVMASLGVGALAANWPFWRRAWAWHSAPEGWPAKLEGPQVSLRGGGVPPWDLAPATPSLAAAAADADTRALLRVRDGQAEAWFAPGFTDSSLVDGGGLTRVLLAPLFSRLEARHPGLLEQPVGAWLEAWRQDERGAIAVRTLLRAALDDLDQAPAAVPLNPFSPRARLASGGDFQRAALSVFREDAVPPARAAAAAQLLASVAQAAEARPYAEVIGSLWSEIAAGNALLPLDHRRGQPAAHCCMRATAGDWLRIGLSVAAISPGEAVGPRNFRAAGRMLWLQHPGAVVLWIGSGEPPSALETLLTEAPLAGAETSARH